MEKRKNLRERSYAKYLRDAKVKAFPLNQLTIVEKTALPARQGEERGILLGLYDSHHKFLGIGVLREIARAKYDWTRTSGKSQFFREGTTAR